MITAFHILPVTMLFLVGFAVGNVIRVFVPTFEPVIGAFLVGIPLILLFTWPIYRLFSINLVLGKCPICKKRPAFFYQGVHTRGLLLACSLCESVFVLGGEWRLVGDDRIFRCDAEPRIEVIDEHDAVVSAFVMGWPRPFGRWLKVKPEKQSEGFPP